MAFLLRRYWNGIKKRAGWLWICLFPPLIYMAFVLANPHAFVVARLINVNPQAPVTRAPGAVTAVPVRTLVQERSLFEDEQTYWTLESRLEQEFPREYRAGIPLWSILHDAMVMQFQEADRLELSYRGPSRLLGEFLVDFFAQRLVARTKEGRLVAANESTARLDAAGIRIDVPPAEILGDVQLARQRTLSGQGGAIFILIVVSFCVTVLVLGALEWADPSFKSERQAGRYLGVPVLGSLPDLERILERLDEP